MGKTVRGTPDGTGPHGRGMGPGGGKADGSGLSESRKTSLRNKTAKIKKDMGNKGIFKQFKADEEYW